MIFESQTPVSAPLRLEPSAQNSERRQRVESLRICVGIATRGRPAQLQSVVEHLRLQTLQPDQIIVSCESPGDVGALEESARVRILAGRPGLARQRNRVLDSLPDETALVAFFDDDFYPHRDWLRVAAAAFRDDSALVCLTGNVVADGITGPGLTFEDAGRVLNLQSPSDHPWVIEGYSPYGCNMAFRRSAISGLRFDERLVLYGWLEDRDFGARVAKDRGRLVKLGAAIGVHLGVKGGRVSGRRLGYSQIMNPYYMRRKGTITTPDTLRQAARNFSMNLVRSIWPERYIDRRGRLLGNLIAVGDIIAGRCSPERAELL
jgi:GT2 family glycosyltransferase